MVSKQQLPKDPQRLIDLARDSTTSQETLDAVADVGLPFLWEYVAQNASVSPHTLAKLTPRKLSSETDLRAAAAVAHAVRSPAEALQRLVELVPPDCLNGARREQGGYVALFRALAEHPNTPAGVLASTLRSCRIAKRLRLDIAASTCHRTVLEVLAEDPVEAVRLVATRRLADSVG